MEPLNCFVASAFGREDVDDIYKTALKPLLKTLKNTKLKRVDLINHNKEITTKIIELIRESDFGIIDLTYARPSVYYEAGYLEGQNKPVIYIVRDDHFERKPSNEIVHFDLSVKNIIKWSELQSKLLSRVSLITRPLILKQQVQMEELEAQAEFERLSLRERILTIEKNVIKHFKSLGFREQISRRRYTDYSLENKGVRAFVTSSDTLTQNGIFLYARDAFLSMRSDGFNGLRVVILCSIKKVPQHRIEKALRSFTRANEFCYFEGNSIVFFLQPITSFRQLNKILDSVDFPIDAPVQSQIIG